MGTTHITATRHGSAAARIEHALETALTAELRVDDREQSRRLIEAAGLADEAREIARERARTIERLAGIVALEVAPLARRVEALHRTANDVEAERVASLDRVDGLIRGPVAG